MPTCTGKTMKRIYNILTLLLISSTAVFGQMSMTTTFEITYESGHTLVEVFNSIGEKAATLVNRELPAGFHQVKCNVSDSDCGIYLYRITTQYFTNVKKLILLCNCRMTHALRI